MDKIVCFVNRSDYLEELSPKYDGFSLETSSLMVVDSSSGDVVEVVNDGSKEYDKSWQQEVTEYLVNTEESSQNRICIMFFITRETGDYSWWEKLLDAVSQSDLVLVHESDKKYFPTSIGKLEEKLAKLEYFTGASHPRWEEFKKLVNAIGGEKEAFEEALGDLLTPSVETLCRKARILVFPRWLDKNSDIDTKEIMKDIEGRLARVIEKEQKGLWQLIENVEDLAKPDIEEFDEKYKSFYKNPENPLPE